MELSNGWISLLAAEDPGLISWLGDKIWIWSAVALGVGLVIFVHELGHFLAAKLFGVKVEKFYVGFDVPINLFGIKLPRSFGRFRWGETEYGIGVIPLGGYVKMLGQDDDPRQAAAERERVRQANAARDVDADEPGEPESYPLDPRSFPAKTVWQRMIIISAGVVMNLITAVIFAAIAFGFGVNYQPAIIGQTVAGFPAWEAGVEPGGRIVSVGTIDGDPKLHFDDMTLEIAKVSINDPDDPVKMKVQYGDELREYSLSTRESPRQPAQLRMVGIGSMTAAQLGGIEVAAPNSSAANALSKANRGAKIVAVDGTPLPVDPLVGMPLDNELEKKLLFDRDQPIELTLLDQDDIESKVTLAPQKVKSFGLSFEPGRVAALVKEGPAAQAGVQVGDQITGVNGSSEADAITLPGIVAGIEGTVTLSVVRGEGEAAEKLDIAVTPDTSRMVSSLFTVGTDQVELGSLGLTYRPEAVVKQTTDSELGLEAGDTVRRVRILWSDSEDEKALTEVTSKALMKLLTDGWEINDENSLVSLITALQILPVGTGVEIKAVRGPEMKVVETKAQLIESDQDWYERGLILTPATLVHQADSIGDAMSLGFREVKRKGAEVFSFLKMAVTGRVGLNMLGGPIAIATVAGSAASDGITSLLMFLTFLSVNLAILNFLPIPALDGGHMVFLICEAARGKPVDEELQAKLTMAGVLALLLLMGFVIVNDWLRLVS